jgi:hypothetical protein
MTVASDAPEIDEMRPPKMLGTISIMKWKPDLDKVKETLDGIVPPQRDDVVTRGGSQWPTKPE